MGVKVPKSWRELRAMDLEIARSVLGWKSTYKTRVSMKSYDMGERKRMYRLTDAKGQFVGLHTDLDWAGGREYIWYDSVEDVWDECCPAFTTKIEHAWSLAERFRVEIQPAPKKTWKAVMPYGSGQGKNVCAAICVCLLRHFAKVPKTSKKEEVTA